MYKTVYLIQAFPRRVDYIQQKIIGGLSHDTYVDHKLMRQVEIFQDANPIFFGWVC